MKNLLFIVVIFSMICCNESSTEVIKDVPLKENSKLKLSLAEWSLHRTIQSNKMSHLDFAGKAAALGATGVEYVSGFFKNYANNAAYLKRMNELAKEAGVEQLLIMVDGEGNLSDPVDSLRDQAVINHQKWVDAAKFLGCHSIRVNLFGEMDNREAWIDHSIKGLRKLSSYAQNKQINILVENHGGFSSDGEALATVIKTVGMENCGTLPDFGNFCTKREGGKLWGTPCLEEYDRYKGVEELMPYAKAVSAKSYAFDETGQETTINFEKMIQTISKQGYNGYIGIEYEGEDLTEEEGILATKKLLIHYLNKL